MYHEYFKRIFDFILAFFLLVFLLPLMVSICVLIIFTMGSPVFFLQDRIGVNGRVFRLIKFRSMTNAESESESFDEPNLRTTKIGRFLRKSSLDELPELWNILRGQMSFVGPRPLPKHYSKRFTTRQWKRHCVRPGLTGLAQIKGRTKLTWLRRFSYDLWYTNNGGIFIDLSILFLTARTLIDTRSAEFVVEKEMPDFRGQLLSKSKPNDIK